MRRFGLISIAILGLIPVAGLAGTVSYGGTAAAVQAHSVPLTCQYGDMRTAADASVQPGVIVADSTFPPTTYTPYSIDSAGNLEIIGSSSTVFTTDHLVAAWQNSTNCYGSSISRNTWVTDANGAVIGESDYSGPPALNFGDMNGRPLNRPMVGMSPTSDAKGYWEVASDGGIFAFGDAQFHGSTGNLNLNKPVVGMAVTPDGGGYWMVATDGGIFAFGTAGFYGSTGSLTLNQPIEAMTATPDGHGYWMVASDGGIFAFGDAGFHGSLGGRTLSAPISGMIPNGSGYTLIGQDGQEYPFS
jgi:hypothetical protein